MTLLMMTRYRFSLLCVVVFLLAQLDFGSSFGVAAVVRSWSSSSTRAAAATTTDYSTFETIISAASDSGAKSSDPIRTIATSEEAVAAWEKQSSSSPSLSVWTRATEIVSILADTLGPILLTLAPGDTLEDLNGDDFWNRRTGTSQSSSPSCLTNAERVAYAFEQLGCTYVKFGQAVASRPDIIPPTLAKALCKLQDRMEPFDTTVAREILHRELRDVCSVAEQQDMELLLAGMSSEPVAAASIGQVYRAHLPNYGPVAIKVQRPGIRETVQRDAMLLKSLAQGVESLPSSLTAIFLSKRQRTTSGNPKRLIAAKLVDSVDEFMNRLFEELDYRREAQNMKLFAQLYCHRTTNTTTKYKSKGVRVVVPKLIEHLCTDHVIVMEWLEGSKLLDLLGSQEDETVASLAKENLALVQTGIECTLSQLLDTGIMHADPHTGNLLKVPSSSYSSSSSSSGTTRSTGATSSSGFELGYLDFGILSTVPASVRDGLVCAVVQLVFARNVDAVARLFGELQLLPLRVLQDPVQCQELAAALQETFDRVLQYNQEEQEVDQKKSRLGTGIVRDQDIIAGRSIVPVLRFDNLLGSLAGLVARFEFALPPYFLNNARALGTLEGIARKLDPSFNVLRVVYPFALNRLLMNPSGSRVVETTLLDVLRCPRTGHMQARRVAKLLDDSAALTGNSRRRVIWDIVKTRGGQRFLRQVATGLTKSALVGKRSKERKTDYYFRL